MSRGREPAGRMRAVRAESRYRRAPRAATGYDGPIGHYRDKTRQAMTVLRALSSFALLLLATLVGAQSPEDWRVDVSLVAETTSAQPGAPLWVALRMDHD